VGRLPSDETPSVLSMVCPVGCLDLFVPLIQLLSTIPGLLQRAFPARLLLLQYPPLDIQVADLGQLISLMWLEWCN